MSILSKAAQKRRQTRRCCNTGSTMDIEPPCRCQTGSCTLSEDKRHFQATPYPIEGRLTSCNEYPKFWQPEMAGLDVHRMGSDMSLFGFQSENFKKTRWNSNWPYEIENLAYRMKHTFLRLRSHPITGWYSRILVIRSVL